MTVKELIEALQTVPENALVYLDTDWFKRKPIVPHMIVVNVAFLDTVEIILTGSPLLISGLMGLVNDIEELRKA